MDVVFVLDSSPGYQPARRIHDFREAIADIGSAPKQTSLVVGKLTLFPTSGSWEGFWAPRPWSSPKNRSGRRIQYEIQQISSPQRCHIDRWPERSSHRSECWRDGRGICI